MHMCRVELALQVALLHDVTDDTIMNVADVEAAFGTEVAEMVRKVSQLSTLNQLLRRRKRQEVSMLQCTLSSIHLPQECVDSTNSWGDLVKQGVQSER